MSDRYKGLEPGAAEHARHLTGIDTPAALQAAAAASAAITFKRLVDMLEPIARQAAAEIEAELEAKQKGR